MFQPPRDRDAYASIRGYVYQIDRTVEQWLVLAPGQVLELERGEDIDLVGRFIATDGDATTQTRLLEQVKHRETGITLRTPAALEALANFHSHRQAVAECDLKFRFLTNAIPGAEQFSPFPNRIPGITLWEHVRTRQLNEPALQAAAGRLRSFLVRSQRPDGLNEAVWADWKAYVERVSPDEFRGFIDRFEWSTAHPDAVGLPLGIQTQIRSLGLASDEAEAQAVADRLFVHVTRHLAAPGPKRLTVEDRATLLAAPPLSAADRGLLVALRAVVEGHTDRLDQLEADVTALGGRFEALFFSNTSGERVELSLPDPDLSLPQPVARLSSRTQTAEYLRDQMRGCGWLALRGGPDTGKSQLALQLAIGHGVCRGWVRFHHTLPGPAEARRLEAVLAALGGRATLSATDVQTYSPLAALASGSLIVLDDIPRLTGDDVLAESLARLGLAAKKAQVQIVSTSQFEFPARLCSQFATGWIRDQSAPPFTDVEAGELFRAHGASETFLTGPRLQFLNRLAAGHPLLLAAVAEFLAGRGWCYTEEEIDGLLRGDHAEAIIPEVVERLTRTLDDPPRELLYRLTLPRGAFTQADVSAVAGVAPAVDRPRERFNQLLGAWVQRDTETRYEVSPLVRPLGRTEITVDVRTGCYRSLAEVITHRRVMDPLGCDRAIFYNLEAREHARAITLYVLFLFEVLKSKPPKQIAPLIDRWRHEPLPEDLSLGNRLFVRAYQLAAFTQCKLDTRFVVEDIDTLLGQATVADGWAIVALAVQSLTGFRTRDPARVLRYVRAAVELPVILGPDGQEMVFDTVSIPSLLWMLVTDLRTPALLGQWLDAVAAIPGAHHGTFWSSHLAQQGVWLVGNKVYLTECEKPAARKDWAGLLRALGELRKRAQPIGQPRLEAALTGVMLEILGDRKWLDQAPEVAQESLSRWPDNPDVEFEVRGTWGRQYAYQKRPDLALPLLDAALSQPHSPHDHERLRCLLAASTCVGPDDLRYAEQARDLARASDLAPDIEAARALGEYAISVQLARGGREGAIAACPAWSEAMRRFYGARGKDMIWRDLFPLFAHGTSYLHSMAREGRPPEHACDGGAFAVPSRGFLMKDYMPEREALYREGGRAAVAWIMQSYASSSGVVGEADHWMRFAIDESRRVGASFIQAATGTDAAAVMLANGKFEDAIEIGVFAGRGSVVHRVASEKSDGNFEGMGVDVSDAFRSLPEGKRRLGDRFAVISGLVPAALTIVGLSRSDPAAATSALGRVAAICRELTEDGLGDSELWRSVTELFELTASPHATAGAIRARIRLIEGDGEREVVLRVLGHVLATAHAGPEEAMSCQLGMIEVLCHWYPSPGAVNRFVLLPYIEAYWRFAARNSRFAFRAPAVTGPAIESALEAPVHERIYSILSAAANGFMIRGARDVLQRLRQGILPAS